jgi:hypothetical protein
VADGAVEEERRLQVHVELEVPVVLGHVVDCVPAPEHGRQVREHVETPERLAGALQQRCMRVEIAEVDAGGEVAVGRIEVADDLRDGVLAQVDRAYPRPLGRERLGDGASDPARRAGHHHAAALEPEPAHSGSSTRWRAT